MLKRTSVNNSDLCHQLPAQFTNLARLWIQGPIAPGKTFPLAKKHICISYFDSNCLYKDQALCFFHNW